jgi:hypothetical protein
MAIANDAGTNLSAVTSPYSTVSFGTANARAIRLAREDADRLRDGDVELPAADLAAYDAFWGAGVTEPTVFEAVCPDDAGSRLRTRLYRARCSSTVHPLDCRSSNEYAGASSVPILR